MLLRRDINKGLFNTTSFYADKISKNPWKIGAYEKVDTPSSVGFKCLTLLTKFTPVFERSNEYFKGPILDFASGSGEHSHFLSSFLPSVNTYDAQPIHQSFQINLFRGINNISILTQEEDCFKHNYHTVLGISFFHLINDQASWFLRIAPRIKTKYFVFITRGTTLESDKVYLFHPSSDTSIIRHTRVYDNELCISKFDSVKFIRKITDQGYNVEHNYEFLSEHPRPLLYRAIIIKNKD